MRAAALPMVQTSRLPFGATHGGIDATSTTLEVVTCDIAPEERFERDVGRNVWGFPC